MPTVYFDIVLYIIRSKNINDLNPKDESFGYQCFSDKNEDKRDKDNKGYKDNKLNVNYQYYYNEIKGESLTKIENYYNGCFTELNIETKDNDD